MSKRCLIALVLVTVGIFGPTPSAVAQDSINHLPNFLDHTELFNFGQKYPYLEQTNLLFEMQLAPPFLMYGSRLRSAKRKQALVMTPEFRIRLLNAFSGPVVTPSYLLHLRYYRQSRLGGKRHPDFWVLSLNHHSNGQQEHILHYVIDADYIDTLRGNFSTHYLNFYYFKQFKSSRLTHWLGLGYEEHFPDSLGAKELPGGMIKFLSENYGTHRVLLVYRLMHRWPLPGKFLEKATIRWELDLDMSLKPAQGNPLHIEFRDKSKLPTYQLDIGLTLLPDWSSSLGLFVRYRSGQDPYNLFFFNNIDRIEFGLSLHPDKISFGK